MKRTLKLLATAIGVVAMIAPSTLAATKTIGPPFVSCTHDQWSTSFPLLGHSNSDAACDAASGSISMSGDVGAQLAGSANASSFVSATGRASFNRAKSYRVITATFHLNSASAQSVNGGWAYVEVSVSARHSTCSQCAAFVTRQIVTSDEPGDVLNADVVVTATLKNADPSAIDVPAGDIDVTVGADGFASANTLGLPGRDASYSLDAAITSVTIA